MRWFNGRLPLVPVVMIAVLVSSCTQSRQYAEPPADSYTTRTMQLTVAEHAESVPGADVTSVFFQTAKAPPLLGRVFLAGDDRPDAAPAVVLHHDLWTRVFKSEPGVIGTSIQIDGRPHMVVGVMPRDFNVPAGALIWRRAAR